jgi:plasmid stabilization system protein ParE
MSYSHIFNMKAADEYENALLWYQQQSDTAGDRLIVEVEENIKTICADPYRYRNTHKKLRETSLKIFPYSIVFLVDEPNQVVVIISLFHHKRNPKKKYRIK